MTAERIIYLWITRFIYLLANGNTNLVMTEIVLRLRLGFFFRFRFTLFFGGKVKTKVIQEPTANDT